MRTSVIIIFALWAAGCTASGEGGADCYGPGTNLDRAYDDGARGCACDPATDEAVCEQSSEGRGVALVCEDGAWQAVEDGACYEPVRCYSPTQNLETVTSPNAVGCGCDPAVDEDICVRDNPSRAVALICENDRWQHVQDGPCLPPPR